jgi:hypothetical protein
MKAKFSGTICARCDTPIAQGGEMRYVQSSLRATNGSKYTHTRCPDMSDAERDCIDMGKARPRQHV